MYCFLVWIDFIKDKRFPYNLKDENLQVQLSPEEGKTVEIKVYGDTDSGNHISNIKISPFDCTLTCQSGSAMTMAPCSDNGGPQIWSIGEELLGTRISYKSTGPGAESMCDFVGGKMIEISGDVQIVQKIGRPGN